MYSVICPVCKRRSYVDEVSDKILTKDNVKFPINFFNCAEAIDIEPEEIERWIKEGIEFFRKNPEAFSYTTGTGNAGILIQNYSGDKEYHVIVVKNYWDTFIPYDGEDISAQEDNGWHWRNTGTVDWKNLRGIKDDKS